MTTDPTTALIEALPGSCTCSEKKTSIAISSAPDHEQLCHFRLFVESAQKITHLIDVAGIHKKKREDLRQLLVEAVGKLASIEAILEKKL